LLRKKKERGGRCQSRLKERTKKGPKKKERAQKSPRPPQDKKKGGGEEDVLCHARDPKERSHRNQRSPLFEKGKDDKKESFCRK